MFKKSKCAFAAKLGVTMLLSMTLISLFPNLVKDAGIVYAIKVVNSSNINKFLTITTDDHDRIAKVYLNVPERYSKIDKDALQNLPQNIKNKLNTVNLQGIEEVPDGLFSNLPNLESVAIGDKCTKIGELAFFNCQNLNKVELGKNCAVIGKLAFSNCKNLNKIKLGENCAVIEDSAFAGCSALRFVKFPENLKSVGDRSFFGTDIRWLKLEKCNKLENLGPYCFSDCPKLYKVDLPENGNLQTIDGWCFNRCPIKEIKIPRSVTFLGGSCFSGCGELVNVVFAADSQLDYLRMETFLNCKKLKNINIPGSVGKISIGCFKNCTDLESLFLPEKVSEMGKNCFEGCLKLTNINLPPNINPDNIGEGLFKGCSSLKNIKLPKSWKALPVEIFMDCKNLRSIDLGEIKYLKYGCFYGSGIEEIVIPGSVENIGANCFCGCRRLKKVDLSSFDPEKLGQRTDALFSGCANLDEVVLPENLKILPKNMFSNSGIKEIVIPGSFEKIGDNCFNNCKSLVKVDLSSFDPEKLGQRTDALFWGCKNLEEVVLPENLKVLPKNMFSGSGIEEIVIPGSVEKIGDNCFGDCINLEKVDLSSFDPEKLGQGTNAPFSGCVNLEEVVLPKNLKVLPKNMFSGSGIKEIVIPGSVENIGDNCFRSCNRLEKFGLASPNNKNWKLGRGIFKDCGNLKEAVLPQCLTELPSEIFLNCKNMTKVNLNNIENLGESCLAGTGIFLIDLSNVKNVGNEAFSNSNIKYLFIPKKVESIGKGALKNCKSLERVEIDKESEASIGSDCFKNTSVKNFVVPANCHIDGVGVLANNKDLNSFEFLGDKIRFDKEFFRGDKNLCVISCPNMKEFKYKLSAFGGVGENARIYFPPAGKIEQLD